MTRHALCGVIVLAGLTAAELNFARPARAADGYCASGACQDPTYGPQKESCAASAGDCNQGGCQSDGCQGNCCAAGGCQNGCCDKGCHGCCKHGCGCYPGRAYPGRYGQSSDLFPQYYTTPGYGGQVAEMYPCPRPVPPFVGQTWITYQPLLPQEFLYPHDRTYFRQNGDAGWTVTKVKWSCGLFH